MGVDQQLVTEILEQLADDIHYSAWLFDNLF